MVFPIFEGRGSDQSSSLSIQCEVLAKMSQVKTVVEANSGVASFSASQVRIVPRMTTIQELTQYALDQFAIGAGRKGKPAEYTVNIWW